MESAARRAAPNYHCLDRLYSLETIADRAAGLALRSKDEFQRELYIPVGGGGGRNYAECRCIERSAGKPEVRVVQSVKQLGSKLQCQRPFGEPEVLKCRDVPV